MSLAARARESPQARITSRIWRRNRRCTRRRRLSSSPPRLSSPEAQTESGASRRVRSDKKAAGGASPPPSALVVLRRLRPRACWLARPVFSLAVGAMGGVAVLDRVPSSSRFARCAVRRPDWSASWPRRTTRPWPPASALEVPILTRRVMDVIVGVPIADLPVETWAAYKKSREAAARAAAREKAEAEAKRAAEPARRRNPPRPKRRRRDIGSPTARATPPPRWPKQPSPTEINPVAATKTSRRRRQTSVGEARGRRPPPPSRRRRRGRGGAGGGGAQRVQTRRRCVVAMTNLSGDRSLPWRSRTSSMLRRAASRSPCPRGVDAVPHRVVSEVAARPPGAGTVGGVQDCGCSAETSVRIPRCS